jgi:hypothetical protein
LKPEKQKTRYAGSSGELYNIPSPFHPVNATHDDSVELSTMDSIRFLTIDELGTTDRRRAKHKAGRSQAKIALPFQTTIRNGDFRYGEDAKHDKELERLIIRKRSKESRNLQYSGELLV